MKQSTVTPWWFHFVRPVSGRPRSLSVLDRLLSEMHPSESVNTRTRSGRYIFLWLHTNNSLYRDAAIASRAELDFQESNSKCSRIALFNHLTDQTSLGQSMVVPVEDAVTSVMTPRQQVRQQFFRSVEVWGVFRERIIACYRLPRDNSEREEIKRQRMLRSYLLKGWID